ncbi:MAG: hypothetical protein P5678_03200 [Limnospira sp. PMC 1240.20]|uniref:hypothetical protein n=1 Tax=unclassified Limnospira TaxID=2642885 RepID=UPI0028E0DC2C|nr:MULTISPECIES: hypothetical protein [unclassified Limnospira]MDT9207310.1 hypothetical protein [Limnospira sp. PMC 1252.20]MDT9212633.1 hypothetical protein [Limnospira sp. PMC 1256.20]MDT9217561.1 hypothetical protein [Limnospira sp. PMC 1240.20]MDT9253365.1 hypothetical protein [Limnospira sp. PMC 1254.20]MDT9258257.1 hypothetical protein [Limnospira sp. PMC 1236.20]
MKPSWKIATLLSFAAIIGFAEAGQAAINPPSSTLVNRIQIDIEDLPNILPGEDANLLADSDRDNDVDYGYDNYRGSASRNRRHRWS